MKPLPLLLLALATACTAQPAHAESDMGIPMSDEYRLPPPYEPRAVAGPVAVRERPGLIRQIGPKRLIANTVAAAGDAYTTYRCSHKRRTCEEGNPLVRAMFGKRLNGAEAVGAFVAMEVAYVGGSVLIGETLGYDSPVLDVFQIGSIGAHGVAVGLNLRF